MKILFKMLYYICFVGVLCATGFLGYTCFQQRNQLEEIEVIVSSQRTKILKLQSDVENVQRDDIKKNVEDINEALSTLRSQVGDAEDSLMNVSSKMKTVEGSVENLAEGMFGRYPCSDIRLRLDAISFQRLPDEVRDLKQQLLNMEVEPAGYSDLKSTVKSLSNYVYGEYPMRSLSFTESILDGGSVKEQLKKLKRQIEAIEFSLRFANTRL